MKSFVSVKGTTKWTPLSQCVIQICGAGSTFSLFFQQSFPLDPCGEHNTRINTGPIRDPCWVWLPSIDLPIPVSEGDPPGQDDAALTHPLSRGLQRCIARVSNLSCILAVHRYYYADYWKGVFISCVYRNQASCETTAEQLFASRTGLLCIQCKWCSD